MTRCPEELCQIMLILHHQHTWFIDKFVLFFFNLFPIKMKCERSHHLTKSVLQRTFCLNFIFCRRMLLNVTQSRLQRWVMVLVLFNIFFWLKKTKHSSNITWSSIADNFGH